MSTRLRILLVNPAITSPKRARFPLSLLALAAQLRQRHDVTIVDGNVQRAPDYVTRLLTEEHFDAVGISVMGGPQLLTAMEVSTRIRRRCPPCPSSGADIFRACIPTW